MNILDKYIKMEYGNKKDVLARFLSTFKLSWGGKVSLSPGKRVLLFSISLFLYSF